MIEQEEVVVFCDGGSRGNPGPAASGVVIKSTNGKILGEYCEYLGEKTNNFAEYSAVILALQKLHESKIKKADFYLDSLLVVQQLNGNYKVKHPDMKLLFLEVQKLCMGIELTFSHVLRAKNKEADAMVNQCLDAL
jgi:ribonuclease HI